MQAARRLKLLAARLRHGALASLPTSSRRLSTREIAAFEQWRHSTPLSPVTFTEEQMRSERGRLKVDILRLSADPNAVLSIDWFPPDWLPDISDARCQFSFLREASAPQELPRIYTGLRIVNLVTRSRTIKFERCHVGALQPDHGLADVAFHETMVGELQVYNRPIRNLTWDKGYLGCIRVDDANPFTGDVLLRGLQLSPSKTRYGIQWLRDVREKLNHKNNAMAAGVFLASELALSRPEEPWANRLASWVYDLGSQYGTSIARPVYWFLGILLALFLVAFVTGTDTAATDAIGWQHSLGGDGLGTKALRAAIYAFQSVFNPLNLIVPRPLVSINHWLAALLSFGLGMLGIVAFALFLLSVRRRFKLE